MGVQYRVDLCNAAGAKIDELTDVRRLAVAKQVTAPGRVEIELAAQHRAIANLVDKGRIEVWRRWPEMGIDWYRVHAGLFRDPTWETLQDETRIFTAAAPGPLCILGWSVNAYAAGVTNKTTWSNVRAETMMKQLVTNNCTSSATTGNGRDRNRLSGGTLSGFAITVQADAAGGNLLTFDSQRGLVLNELQNIWDRGSGGDFDLVWVSGTTYDFRFYAGQLGTDRSASVTFAETFGTMGRPKLQIIRSNERTVAITAGQGQKDRRAIRIRTGANYSSSNDIETLVDGRQSATNAALDAVGDAALSKARARAALTFTPLQTPARLLDRDYFLGDKVASSYAGQTFTHQVWATAYAFTPRDGEQIAITLRDY